MGSSVYVVMKEVQSSIGIAPQKPHEVLPTLKAAKERVDALNDKATENLYWYVRVPMRS